MHRLLPSAHAFPQRVVDDPQVRSMLCDPIVLLAEEAPLPLGVGIFLPARPPPHDLTSIEAVVQEDEPVLHVSV